MSLGDRVTVSILTFNRCVELERTLCRTLAACEDAPVIVVDNASTDDTPAVLRAFAPRVRAIHLPGNIGAAGRNAGVLAATTPHVALSDDDTFWAPGALSRAAAALDDHAGLAVVTARVLVGPRDREDPTCALMAHSPLPPCDDLPGPPLIGFLAGASMVRRRPFLAAGGFEPRFFLGGEERLLGVDLASAGWAMAYLPEAVVHHHPSKLRDPDARRRDLTRNALWFTWMRRPFASAAAETWSLLTSALAAAPRDSAPLRGLGEALLGAPWALARRRVIPPEVERALQLVERAAAAPQAMRVVPVGSSKSM